MPPDNPARQKRGFALIIALALMAFCLLLLLSLTTLVRVEATSSRMGMERLQARQNCLLSLRVALGSLQKSAGRDQTISAFAEVLDQPVGNINPDNTQWTGIWLGANLPGQSPQAEDGLETIRDWSIDTVGPTWLLSHEQDVVPNPTAPSSALAKGDASRVVDFSTLDDRWDKSRPLPAAKVAISEHDDLAYFVIDETLLPVQGISPMESRSAPDSGTVEARRNALAPGRSGLPNMSEIRDTDANFDLSATWQDWARHTDTDLLADWLGLTADASLNLLGHASYSTTTLLTDSRRGGLKKNLSDFLRTGNGPTPASSIVEPANYPGLSVTNALPNWALLRSWYQIGLGLADGGAATVSANAAHSPNQSGLHPALVRAAMAFGLSYRRDLTANGGAGADYGVIRAYPRVDLWNPYDATLAARTLEIRYEMGFRTQPESRDAARSEQQFKSSAGRHEMAEFDIGSWLDSQTGQRYMSFQIDVPDMDPGQVLYFYLSGFGTLYQGTDPSTRVMTNGSNPLGGFAYVDTNLPVTMQGDPQPIRLPDDDSATALITQFGPRNLSLSLHADDNTTLTQFDDLSNVLWQRTTTGAQWQQATGVTDIADIGTHEIPTMGVHLTLHSGYSFNDHGGATWQNSLRPWASYAPTAPLQSKPSTDNANNLLWSSISNTTPAIFNDFEIPSGSGSGEAYALFTEHRPYTADEDLTRYVFAELPRLAAGGTGLASMGQFQQVPFYQRSWQPYNAFGNAWADKRIPRDQVAAGTDYVDLSYLLNDTLWDGYFLSEYTASGDIEQDEFLATNLRFADPSRDALDVDSALDFDLSALNFVRQGSFNVNSTDPDAWRSLLYAGRGLDVQTRDGGSLLGSADTAFSRYSHPELPAPQLDGAPKADTFGDDIGLPGNWASGRALSDMEIDALADAIVDQVRERGPFLSISDFINRRLSEDDDPRGIRGALQAAIDIASAPPTPDDPTSGGQINAEFRYDSGFANARNAIDGATKPEYLDRDDWDPEHALGVPEGEWGYRWAGIPGFLTQADLLRVIGDRLTVRGDTFRIYAYGEYRNPVTDNRSYAACMATVQRVYIYVDPTDSPEATSGLQPNNERFGRHFRIVAFEWL